MKETDRGKLNLDRQSFLGKNSASILDRTRVAIVGLGGGGSHIAQQLGHLGVGEFVLIDPDVVEDTNLNRLVGAKQVDVTGHASKASVAARTIVGVNSRALVWVETKRWQECAVALRSCDAIFGCVDSLGEREQLETAARRYLTPYIDIGMDVHQMSGEFFIGGQVALSMPEGPCLRCMGIIDDRALGLEAQQYGAAGGRPQVVWPNGLLASLAVGFFVQLVSPWHKGLNLPLLLEFDGNSQTVSPSSKLRYLEGRTCPHFAGLSSLGDPFLDIAARSPGRLAQAG
ncbi:MAG TPA: ThiF family adenylyltransferase [Candidatus Acidoferrum sp.]|nr:ThiF family adenylyltransferase [Candidatus Acidoferrum sp.]